MSNEAKEPKVTERRKDYGELLDKLDVVITQQTVLKTYVEKQFGGVDLVGTPVEGDVTKQLRELNEKFKIQNGRVNKLEIRSAYLTGGLALLAFGIPVVMPLIMEHILKTVK